MIPSLLCLLALFLSAWPVALSYSTSHGGDAVPIPVSKASENRRAFLTHITHITHITAAASLLTPLSSSAFDNRLDDKYADATPQVGTQPTDLGVSPRPSKSAGSYTGLAPCPKSPNCWCSAPPPGDNLARYLPAWKGGSISDVKKIIDTYEVGHGGIDGGGFQIKKYDEKNQYIYVQFQSYKAGYVDDFEAWFNPEKGQFDVRTASRLGMSDLGVNAKRLDYIGTRLEKEYGWVLERRKNGSLV